MIIRKLGNQENKQDNWWLSQKDKLLQRWNDCKLKNLMALNTNKIVYNKLKSSCFCSTEIKYLFVLCFQSFFDWISIEINSLRFNIFFFSFT